MTRTWLETVVELDTVIAGMRWGQFVIVDYDLCGLRNEAPYAQAACDPHGWYAEVASETNAAFWRHDATWLREAGWERPCADDNWQRGIPNADDVARQLVDGLRFGRGCLLPDLFTIRVGRFDGPPDGGRPQEMGALIAA